jgi:hypothetical protein
MEGRSGCTPSGGEYHRLGGGAQSQGTAKNVEIHQVEAAAPLDEFGFPSCFFAVPKLE